MNDQLKSESSRSKKMDHENEKYGFPTPKPTVRHSIYSNCLLHLMTNRGTFKF